MSRSWKPPTTSVAAPGPPSPSSPGSSSTTAQRFTPWRWGHPHWQASPSMVSPGPGPRSTAPTPSTKGRPHCCTARSRRPRRDSPLVTDVDGSGSSPHHRGPSTGLARSSSARSCTCRGSPCSSRDSVRSHHSPRPPCPGSSPPSPRARCSSARWRTRCGHSRSPSPQPSAWASSPRVTTTAGPLQSVAPTRSPERSPLHSSTWAARSRRAPGSPRSRSYRVPTS